MGVIRSKEDAIRNDGDATTAGLQQFRKQRNEEQFGRGGVRDGEKTAVGGVLDEVSGEGRIGLDDVKDPEEVASVLPFE